MMEKRMDKRRERKVEGNKRKRREEKAEAAAEQRSGLIIQLERERRTPLI